jgi:hypothetical protein
VASVPSSLGPAAGASQPKTPHPRAAGSYQFQRQRALAGHGAAVAEARGCSWHTLESEIDKLERCPVTKTAATLRAMSARGLPPENLCLYIAEILDVLQAAALTDHRPLAELQRQEQIVDGDEDVAQLEAVQHPSPTHRRDHEDQLLRYVAIARALVTRYDLEEGVA